MNKRQRSKNMVLLAEKRCRPVQEGEEPLKGEELAKFVHEIPGWELVEDRQIQKTFKFRNFVEALEFTNRVGEVAEEEGHHPDIHLSWGKVKIDLWTHKVKG